MPPVESAPPSFYERAAAMQGGSSAAPSPGTPKGQKNPDSEIIQGLSKMFQILDKLIQLGDKTGKQALREKLMPAADAIKNTLAEVFKVDVNKPESAPPAGPEGVVEGNKSPQGVPDMPPPPPDATAQTA